MDSLIGRKREVDELKRLYISARSDKITLFAEICLQNLCSSKKSVTLRAECICTTNHELKY